MNKWNDQSTANFYNKINYSNLTDYLPPKNTYFSQFNQDRSLENCIFKGFKNGVFMDIGAHDGIDHNNTLYFEVNNNSFFYQFSDWKYILTDSGGFVKE